MKIYTKTGDDGSTGLFGGGRVFKDHVRVEAYGSVDELNAVLGLARAEGLPPDLEGFLARIQDELFTVGAILATPSSAKAAQVVPVVEAAWVTALEEAIDALTLELPPLTHFILPSGARSGALLHLARTVCRRAERRVIALLNTGESAPAVVVYLNRLSDFLFVLARAVNHRSRIPESPWVPKRPA